MQPKDCSFNETIRGLGMSDWLLNRSRKILVTGGSGFIGSHLVDLLCEKGHRVRVADRHVPYRGDVGYMRTDLSWLGDAMKATEGIDVVYHLAARISVDESLDLVRQYFHDNLMSTVNVCLAAQRSHVKRFIYISSCEVYGNVAEGKADEQYPCNPTSPYAASKYSAERAAIACCTSSNIPIIVLRPFNTFGERQKAFRAGSVIPTFILQAIHDKALQIHGDGLQTRDYLYVKDIVQAMAKTSELSLKTLQDEHWMNPLILNIASGTEQSILGLAQKIVALVGSGYISHVSNPRKTAQLVRSVGNAELAQHLLNWKPSISFDTALQQVVKYYRRHASTASLFR